MILNGVVDNREMLQSIRWSPSYHSVLLIVYSFEQAGPKKLRNRLQLSTAAL